MGAEDSVSIIHEEYYEVTNGMVYADDVYDKQIFDGKAVGEKDPSRYIDSNRAENPDRLTGIPVHTLRIPETFHKFRNHKKSRTCQDKHVTQVENHLF